MTLHVVGIGNAVADVISHAPDTFLAHMGIEKGIMQLIDRERAELLYAAMTDRVETPGGSVANTIAGLGALGLDCGFAGKVADDPLGRFYAEALERDGTRFLGTPVAGDLPTSRSMIFVSPEGERSMNTYLGISAELGPDDVDEATMKAAEILFLEGYLFDKDKGKAAFEAAAAATSGAGGRCGITLSDPFCVERHREDFQELISGPMNYVIGNEHEWEKLYETDLDTALDRAAELCEIVVCTRSGDPVIVAQRGDFVEVPVERREVVDATGAGDQFAAGFLYGLSQGRGMKDCARMGVIAAGEVIGHVGPRPEADVRALFGAAGL